MTRNLPLGASSTRSTLSDLFSTLKYAHGWSLTGRDVRWRGGVSVQVDDPSGNESGKDSRRVVEEGNAKFTLRIRTPDTDSHIASLLISRKVTPPFLVGEPLAIGSLHAFTGSGVSSLSQMGR